MGDDLVLDELHVAGQGRLTARLLVPPTHPLLAGHFPGAALVPGVLLLDAAGRAAAAVLGRELALRAVDDARFFQPLLPGVAAELRAAVACAGDEVEIDGDWSRGGERLAAFRLRLGSPA